MKVFEFRSDMSDVVDNSEPFLDIETEIFLSKSKAIDYMISKALEYEKANKGANFYRNVKDYPKDSETIELENSRCCDVFGIFCVTEKEIIE